RHPGEQGQQRTGVEVAAGLADGDLPGPQHLPLSAWWQKRTDHTTKTRTVGAQVEGEQGDGQPVEEQRQEGCPGPQEVVGDTGRVLLHEPAGTGDLVEQGCGG